MLSGMGRHGQDRDLSVFRAVTPEDSPRFGRAILNIGFEDLLVSVVWIFQGRKLVGIQTGMSRILEQQTYALLDLLEETFGACRL
jgi:hypothetical protein